MNKITQREARAVPPAKVWVAISRWGYICLFTVSVTRRGEMEKAVGMMLDWKEFERLGTTSARWRSCYRRGARVARCTIAVEAQS